MWPVRVLVLLGALIMALPAHAEPTVSKEAQDEADLLFEEGRVLLAKGEYAKACAKLEKANRIDPNAEGAMLNLGLCNEKLGKYKKALFWFRKALQRATESDTPMPAHERVAKEHAAALATKIATITIAFPGDGPPAGTTVKIDDEPVAPDDYARVEIDPGHHALTAEAPGLAADQSFDVDKPGSQTTITVAFKSVGKTVTDPGAAAPTSGRRKRVALWLGVGAVTTLAASAGLTLYERSVYGRCTTDGELDTQKSGCDHGTDPYAAATEANDARRTARIYGTGLFAVGGVALVLATYLYLSAPSSPERTSIAPVITRDQIGVALTGAL